jgi:hypothetical protein
MHHDNGADETLGRIERGLAHELEGAVHLDCRPDGFVRTLDIPLPRVARG